MTFPPACSGRIGPVLMAFPAEGSQRIINGHCPKCGQKLAMEKCGSVEMDVCPSCKGVWLDVGELGTIVESAGQGSFFHTCLRILRRRQPQTLPLGVSPGDADQADEQARLAKKPAVLE